MRKQNIAVGKSYVNEREQIARQVVEEIDQRKVKYNAFGLKDGRLTPAVGQICRKSDLAHWADREANLDEIAKMHPFEQLPWFEAIPPREVKKNRIGVNKSEHPTSGR
jgi:hypothetical protein